MKIAVEGASKADGSYGLVNIYLAAALASLGQDVTLSPWDQPEDACRRQIQRSFGDTPLRVTNEVCSGADVRIRQIWPPVWSRPIDGAKLVVIQPWEFGSIPLEWVEGIGRADAIWVPSSYVKAGYIQSGIHPDKVWIVPNGTDLASTARIGRAPERSGGSLSLLFVGGGIFRKGIDLLITSLDKLPSSTLQRSHLTIKETGHDSYYAGQSLVDSSLNNAPRVAKITNVIRDHLDRQELTKLMLASDALVHPYRSEGFALPVIEAMGLGLPVVVTKGGATDDFCSEEDSTLLDADLTVESTPYVGETLTADLPYFLTPRVEHLSQTLQALLDGPADLESKREAALERASHYTWEHVGATAITALEAILRTERAEDGFSTIAKETRAFLTKPLDGTWTDLCNHLLTAGDLKSAARVVQLAETNNPNDPHITSLSRRLHDRASRTPDLWSGAPWRLDLSALGRETGTVPAVVHRHEGDVEATSRIARSITPYFAGCRIVLDLGCGQGSMLRTLRSLGKDVVGVEGDPDLVSQLRGDGFDVREGWIPTDLGDLGDIRADGLFLGHIVEHLTTTDALAVLRWAADHLNDNGVVVIQTPDFSVDFVSKTNFWLDPTHVRPYPLQLLKGMLESAGFSPLIGGCRPLGPQAPLDVIAVGKLRRSERMAQTTKPRVSHRSPCRPRVGHLGLFGSDSGTGRASRTLLDEPALAHAGIDVLRIDLSACEGSALPRGTVTLADSLNAASDMAIIDVPVGWLPEVLPRVRARHTVLRFAFEAFPLPAYLAESIRSVDEVWAMSHYAADIAIASGAKSSSVTVLHPALTAHWQAQLELRVQAARRGELCRRSSAGRTIFSSVFNFEPRKNPEALIRSFLELLTRGHNAHLLVKASGIDTTKFWEWAVGVVGREGTDRLKLACELHCEPLDEPTLSDLISRSDVFVLPTRGEGFGLPFLEAMSVGVPVICPDVGGHRDFCDADNSFLVPTTSVPCALNWDIPLFRESRWREVDYAALVSTLELAATADELVTEKALSAFTRAAAFMQAQGASAHEKTLELCRRLRRHDSGSVAAA